jgi:hypothetical protein
MLTGLTLGTGLFVAGCAAGGHDHTAAATDGVRCDKCQVTWVRERENTGKGSPIVAYKDTKKMECPECRDEVANLITTGKFQHTCKACGGNMTVCEKH